MAVKNSIGGPNLSFAGILGSEDYLFWYFGVRLSEDYLF